MESLAMRQLRPFGYQMTVTPCACEPLGGFQRCGTNAYAGRRFV